MKTTLKIVLKELAFLKNSIILIGIILILFSGAFLSVLSVRIDVPEGMYDEIDHEVRQITCRIKNVTIAEARGKSDSFYGEIEGITSDVTLLGNNNKSKDIMKVEMTSSSFFSINTKGVIVGQDPDFSALEELCGENEKILEGVLPKLPFEALISKALASSLSLKLSDTLKIKDLSFKVVGIYDSSKYNAPLYGAELPIASYYLVMPENTSLDNVYLDYISSHRLRLFSRILEKQGYEVVLTDNLNARLKIIDLARSFFMSVAIVLAIVTFFVQYALIATFFRQRRTQICRLKLLGATDRKIALIYCLIAFGITILAVTAGAFMSLLFNKYFINLCNTLFENQFVSHFRASISLITGSVLLFFTLLIYRHSVKKIAKFNVIEEIKHE